MKKYDFCKMVGKHALRTLRNDFGVDIQNLDVSENFKGQKYNKVEMQNDIFLFFNKDSLIGMLIGNERNKKYIEFERTFITEFDGYTTKKLNRNRKNYELFSTEIIRIKKSDMKLNKIYPISSAKESSKQKLSKRLKEYKINKYNNISHEQIIKMSKEVSSLISQRLFTEMPTEYKRIKWYSISNYPEMLEAFAKDVNRYITCYNYMNQNEFNQKYYLKDYNESKIEILKWYQKLI